MTDPNYENDEFWAAAIDIPDDFKLALADFIINFGRLELAIDRLIWWAAGVDNREIGKALTARLDIRPKCEMAEAMLAQFEDNTVWTKFKAQKKEIEDVTKRRNAVVHGWWAAFGETAVAMSIRGKQAGAGAFAGGKPFTADDLGKDGARTKKVERAVLSLISVPTPSFRKHEH